MKRSSHLERAADWAAGLRFSDIPADVVTLEKLQIANILAATIAGSRSAAGIKTRRSLRQSQSRGRSSFIPHGGTGSLESALYLHCVYANALELDDFLYRGHLGQAVVWAPLTLAEAYGFGPKAVLTAQIAANEIAGRVGASITADILHGHQRSYLQRLAAAVCSAKLLGLKSNRFAHALAIAMTQPEYPLHPGEFSRETKSLSAASSVVEGVRAALLAREGFTGELRILECPGGFFDQFTLHRHPPDPFVQFGEAWLTHSLAFKRYSSCAYAAGAVDCVRRLTEQTAFDLEDIVSIRIRTTSPTLIMDHLATTASQEELTPVGVQFSVARSVALALHRKDIRGECFTPRKFAESLPVIRSLVPRIRVVQDWKYSVELLMGLDDGLRSGGSRGSAGILDFMRASREFNRLFGSTKSLRLRDIPEIMMLDSDHRSYFTRRIAKGFRPETASGEAGLPFGNLSRLSWRMGSGLRIVLSSGEVLDAECIIPPGMAGDPHRPETVRDKVLGECSPVLGKVRAAKLFDAVLKFESEKVSRVLSLSTHP